MEIQLKSRYARICGKTGRRGGNMDSAENDSNDSAHSLELYDESTSDFDMFQVSNDTLVYL